MQGLCNRFVEECSKWYVFRAASHFNRRVTCIEWHPDYPHMVAFSSHGGDIRLFDSLNNKSKDEKVIEGVSLNINTCITTVCKINKIIMMYNNYVDCIIIYNYDMILHSKKCACIIFHIPYIMVLHSNISYSLYDVTT